MTLGRARKLLICEVSEVWERQRSPSKNRSIARSTAKGRTSLSRVDTRTGNPANTA